jgi:hypothetical protein
MDEIFATLHLTFDEYCTLMDFLAEQRLDSGLSSIYEALEASEDEWFDEEEYEDEEDEEEGEDE